jgi:hypothetical protein
MRKNHRRVQNVPRVGDRVRISLISEGKERPLDYKGHLAYRRGIPIKWSDKIYTVEKKLNNKARGTIKLFVHGRYRFWPTEVQWIPEDTVPSAVMGQDGNIDYDEDVRGRRRSSRKKKKVKRMDL